MTRTLPIVVVDRGQGTSTATHQNTLWLSPSSSPIAFMKRTHRALRVLTLGTLDHEIDGPEPCPRPTLCLTIEPPPGGRGPMNRREIVVAARLSAGDERVRQWPGSGRRADRWCPGRRARQDRLRRCLARRGQAHRLG